MKVIMKSGQEIEANDVIMDSEESMIVTDRYAVWVDSSEIETVVV